VAFPQSTLPRGLKPIGQMRWLLADGSMTRVQVYDGTASILGIDRPIPVTISVGGREILIGRRFTDNFRVTFDHGREVVVEP